MSDVRSSGATIELKAGPAILRALPMLGGRITSLKLMPEGSFNPVEVLLPFPEDTGLEALLHWPKGGIYPLLPYGNRIRDGRLAFAGKIHQLQPHPDAVPHTLHGPAHRMPWQVTRSEPTEAAWSIEAEAGPEWPWHYAASISARLSPSALDLELELTNRDSEAVPAGLGLHPYFSFGPDDTLAFQATTDWPVISDSLAGAPKPAVPDYDVATRPPTDTTTLYRSGWTGTCTVGRECGYTLELRASPVFDQLVVHRPSAAPYLCLEPASHAPDGFNLSEAGLAAAGRRTLAPGETLRGTARIAVKNLASGATPDTRERR